MSLVDRLAAQPAATRRAIALGILLLLVLAVWALVFVPLRMLAVSQQQWREEVAERIARDRGLAASAPELRKTSEAVRAAPIRQRLFVAGAVGVDAELQGVVSAAMLRAGVEPTTFKVLPGVSTRGLRQHRVEFSSIMSIDQLRAFYAALAQEARHVRIERLRIDAPDHQRADENPRFTVLMEAQGFALDAPAASDTRLAHAN